jgi:hypothetical protein
MMHEYAGGNRRILRGAVGAEKTKVIHSGYRIIVTK